MLQSTPSKLDCHQNLELQHQARKSYGRPQLVVYGPVASLTGGMSNRTFLDASSMTMMNCNPGLQTCP